MLNAMFKEIQSRLGDECGLFREFVPKPFLNEEYRRRYKNLGVLYVNNGNLGSLPDGAMMKISYTLELFMRVNQSYNTSDPVVLPLEKISTGTTGVIYSSAEDGPEYQFILDTGLPTSDGHLVPGGECDYVRFEVPIAVTFVNGVTLADNNHIVFTIDGIEYPPLKSVISFTEAPQTQLETATFVNEDNSATPSFPAMENESVVVATSWHAEINKLYRPADKVDSSIRLKSLSSTAAQGSVFVRYKDGSELAERTRKVIIHDVVFANELGQPAYLTFKLSTAMR